MKKRSIAIFVVTALLLITAANAQYENIRNAFTQFVRYRPDGSIKCQFNLVQAAIELTDPALNGSSAGVYHRVIAGVQPGDRDPNGPLPVPLPPGTNAPSSEFIEFGWLKHNSYGPTETALYYALIPWIGAPVAWDIIEMPTSANVVGSYSLYSVHSDGVGSLWKMSLNGKLIAQRTVSAPKMCRASAGGEVRANVEAMGYTDYKDLNWGKRESDGVSVQKYWPSNTFVTMPFAQQDHYRCVVYSATWHMCYHLYRH